MRLISPSRRPTLEWRDMLSTAQMHQTSSPHISSKRLGSCCGPFGKFARANHDAGTAANREMAGQLQPGIGLDMTSNCGLYGRNEVRQPEVEKYVRAERNGTRNEKQRDAVQRGACHTQRAGFRWMRG